MQSGDDAADSLAAGSLDEMVEEKPVSEEQARKRRKFASTLRKIMREERPLTDMQMAAMFDDDGDLGTQMRILLLTSGQGGNLN